MFFENLSKWIVLFSLVAILGSCGGSTQGTGGITVEGRLLEVNRSPVSGASVTLLSSGESTTTDLSGAFVLISPSAEIPLLFESGETRAETTVSVSPQTSRLIATFKLDRERGRVEAEDVETEEDDNGRDDDDDPVEDDSGDDDDGEFDDDSKDDSSDDDGADSDDGYDDDDEGGDDIDEPDNDGDGDDESGSGSSGSGGNGRREVRGMLNGINEREVTVNGVRFSVASSTEYRDEEGNSVSAQYFTVGMEVKARGALENGVLVLVRLEREED